MNMCMLMVKEKNPTEVANNISFSFKNHIFGKKYSPESYQIFISCCGS